MENYSDLQIQLRQAQLSATQAARNGSGFAEMQNYQFPPEWYAGLQNVAYIPEPPDWPYLRWVTPFSEEIAGLLIVRWSQLA
jgi:hypothetical protein